MSLTRAQVNDYHKASEALRGQPSHDALRSLTDNQLAVLLSDWLIQDVRVSSATLEHISNYLGRQAHMMERDKG
jgi:hypothetical protein